tara:strand:+ start:5186 stop:7810 length:2625 start_codon:yes stop_codon:yes gene_type:complete
LKRKHISFTNTLSILGIFLFLNTTLIFSQQSPINFSYNDKSLKNVLDSLVSIYDLNIVYRDQLVNDIIISADCKNCSNDEAINSVLKNTSLDWEKNKSQYIIINNRNKKTISGYVVDGNTGEFIPHANIYIKDKYLGVMSDEYGFFNLSGEINITDTLIISYIGYHPLKIHNYNYIIYYELMPKIIGTESINIYGEQIEFLQRSKNFTDLAFSPRHIKNLPNIGESDIFRSLQLLPGIQMGNTGFAGLYIRGGTPDQNHIILDGMTIYQLDHFFGFFSSINSSIVKDVQIYRSGFPAKYGGAISSIIDITGKSGSTKKKKLDLFTNMLSAGFAYQQPLSKRGSLVFAARRSFTDQYKTKLHDNICDFLTSGTGLNIGTEIPSDTVSYNSEYLPNFYFYDINGKFTYLPTKKDIISISFYEGKDYLGEEKIFDFPLDSIGVNKVQINEKTRWGNNGISGRWLHRWSDKVNTQLFFSSTKYHSNHLLNSYWNLDNTTTPVYLSQDENQITDKTYRLNSIYNINQNHTIELGISKTTYKTDYSVQLGDSVIFIDESINGNLFESYFQDKWNISSNIEILLGIRSEKFSKSDENYFDPRLIATYRLSSDLSIKVSGSRTHQYLNRFSNDLITNGSKFVWLIPNNYMKPMNSLQKTFGIEYNSLNVFMSIDMYNKILNNISDFSQIVFPVDTYNEITNNLIFQGDGEANGLEVFIRKKNGFLTGWASYSYGVIECKFPELNGGNIFLADHDRTHELKSTLIGSLGKWTLSVTGLISSGRVYTPNDNLMIRENENANYTLQAEPATRNSKRLPAIQRIDLSLNRSMKFIEKKLDVGISIFNVFDRRNISHRSYNLSVDPFIATDVVMLGFTPTISIQLGL